MPDFNDLIAASKKMSEKMKETQEALKKIEVEGVSGGGSVKVVMNGEGELKKIVISFQRRFRPELIDGKIDRECLEIAKSLISSK